MSALADAAGRYAAHGWPVFPLKPCDKVPATAAGFKDASTNPATVRAWWEASPDSNIGVVPAAAGLLVVDVDGPEGEATATGLGLLAEPTLRVETARGVHLYYQLPDGPLTEGVAKLGPGLDVRASRGYVVVPPSVHPNGTVYRFADPKATPLPLPPKALALLITRPNPNGDGPPAGPLPETIIEGARNASLASLAGSARRRGASPAAILALLLAENAERCQPPLDDGEVQAIATSVSRYEPAETPGLSPDAAPSPTEAPTQTDTGNATRLVALHGDRLHYVPAWGRWLVWSPDDGRWAVDHHNVRVRELAKDVGRTLKMEAARDDSRQSSPLFAFGLKSLSAHAITGMVDLARGIAGIPLDHERLDADPWLLGVANGVIDLRTGTLRDADPADLMTLQCPVAYDPDGVAPRWTQALIEWFPDPEVRAYVHRLAGSVLVGAQRDHVFVIHYGAGRNGKGTYLRTLQRVLAGYSTVIHLSLLVEQRFQHHDTVKADLFRTRLAVASETQRRVKLDEASVKNLTGADRIVARRMREDPWEFDPSHSLWLATNYLPEITGRDAGIWSRIRVVKWVTTFPDQEQDHDLDATLAAEASGVLRWLVDGCLAWQREGLAEPKAVVRDTLAYRRAEDALGRFAGDVGLTFRRGLEIDAAELQHLLTEWAEGEGLAPPRRDLTGWLSEQGARQTQLRRKGPNGEDRRPRIWRGVGLDDGDHEQEQTDVLDGGTP